MRNSFFYAAFSVIAGLAMLLACLPGQAQTRTINTFLPAGTRTVFAYSDIFKTHYERPFRNLQLGFEAGYQLNDKIKFTGGLEFWNLEPSPLIAVGNRYYPFSGTFVRYRALIGRTADVAVGLGQNLKIGRALLLEAASDYYLDSREIGFRLGLGYYWQKGAID